MIQRRVEIQLISEAFKRYCRENNLRFNCDSKSFLNCTIFDISIRVLDERVENIFSKNLIIPTPSVIYNIQFSRFTILKRIFSANPVGSKCHLARARNDS